MIPFTVTCTIKVDPGPDGAQNSALAIYLLSLSVENPDIEVKVD